MNKKTISHKQAASGAAWYNPTYFLLLRLSCLSQPLCSHPWPDILVPTDHLIFVLSKTIPREHFSLSLFHMLKFKSQNLFSNFSFWNFKPKLNPRWTSLNLATNVRQIVGRMVGRRQLLRCPSPAYAIGYGTSCSIWSLCAEIVVLHFFILVEDFIPSKILHVFLE